MRNTGQIGIVSGFIGMCLLLSLGTKAQTRFHLDASNGMVAESVVCLAEDTTGILWMGTTEGLQGYDGVGFEHYSTENSGLPTNVFTDIWAEPAGSRLWLGVKSGLAVMDLRTRRIEPFDVNGFYNIADLSSAVDGGLWILNINGDFAHLDLHTGEVVAYDRIDFEGLPDELVALEDRGNGQIWADGANCRWKIDLKSRRVEATGLPEGWDAVEQRKHLTDRNGNRWRGSSDGLDCETHRRSPFSLLPMADGGRSRALCLTESVSGTLWNGYENQIVLSDADGTVVRRLTPKDLHGAKTFTPLALAEDADGRMLIGTGTQGLWRLNLHTGEARQLSAENPRLSIYVLHRQGGRWLVGSDEGVFELRDGEETLRTVSAINRAIPSHHVFGIQTDAEGKTWIGIFGSGIQVFDRQMNRIISLQPPTFPSGAINHLFRDSRNRMWAATCEGIACFSDTRHPERFEAYSLSNGLPTLYTNAIGEDRQGRIWATTNRGLVRWDEGSHQFCTYACQEGLAHHSYSNGALRCLSDGRMMAGGEGGVSVFDPSAVTEPEPLPRLRLMSFVLISANNLGETLKTFIPEDSLTFSHYNNSFILTFGVADAAMKGFAEYAYRINHDGPWMSLGKAPRLTLHGLQPGRYTVEIRMRQMGQPWGDEAACSVSFRVRPPWWQTGWTYACYALSALAFVIYIMYSWRRRLILEQNLRYAEKMVEEMQQKASPRRSLAERESDSPAEGRQEEDAEASDAFIEHLSRVILANLGNENLDIDLLTDLMAMSRSTLYRRMKTTLGMSANEYIRWVRIGEAARRIRSGELNEQTIAAIAADCGFNNLRYFRTCFKKRYGVTPSEYGEQKRS
ncbi:MAG: helix-turn-helix domain-containing protein [Bacteroidaceae bacterium]|nr:helix-turn-helix domain-containing protein [Bacteroidaceae bacterium]